MLRSESFFILQLRSPANSILRLRPQSCILNRKLISGLTRTEFRLDKSRELYRLLRQQMKRMTYTDVANAVGTTNRSLGGPLGIIQEECDKRGWPTITVWVVSKSHGFPSIGCNAQTREQVDWEEAKVRATPWPPEPWW